jgi:SAM-dependent methyltransferase
VAWDGDEYQKQFDELADQGVEVHGEADFVMRFAPASVLDAGCGTGRVARELAHRGVAVVGVDADASMVATARRLSPELDWRVDDLCVFDLGRRFPLVVMAGNVPLFTPSGTQRDLVAGCARHLDAAALLVSGFQLDKGYAVDTYDADCEAAGLDLVERWSTWSGEEFRAGGDYAVSVHRAAR